MFPIMPNSSYPLGLPEKKDWVNYLNKLRKVYDQYDEL